MPSSEWLRKRWMEFRLGYSTYLVFLMGFSNFILIAYNFIPQLQNYLGFEGFLVLFLGVLIPSAVVVGHLHVKNQIPTESKVNINYDPYREKIVKSSKEEMNTDYNLWGMKRMNWEMNFSKWNMDVSNWNVKIAKKNMEVYNFILEKFTAPETLRFDKELLEADKIHAERNMFAEQLENWKKDQKIWEGRFSQMKEGKKSSEVMDY